MNNRYLIISLVLIGSIVVTSGYAESESKIPVWIKSSFQYYSDGLVTDDELVSNLEFLIENDIIKIKSGSVDAVQALRDVKNSYNDGFKAGQVSIKSSPEESQNEITKLNLEIEELHSQKIVLLEELDAAKQKSIRTNEEKSASSSMLTWSPRHDGYLILTHEEVSELTDILTWSPIENRYIISINEETSESTETRTVNNMPQTHEIYVSRSAGSTECEATDECFMPSYLEINVGDTVLWVNDYDGVHSVTSGNLSYIPNVASVYSDVPYTGDFSFAPSGVFDSSLVDGKAAIIAVDRDFSFTFEDVGVYNYFCVIHPWSHGTIMVK